MNPNDNSQRKVFDISRPGRAPAPPNSRSVIIGHKPQINPAVSVDGVAERQPLMDPRQKIEIKATDEATAALQPQQPNTPPAIPELEAAAAAAAPPATQDQQPLPAEVPAALGAAVAPEDKLLENLAPPVVAEHQVITSQHIPHKSSAWKVVIIILVLLLLAAAALDILLDAGFLEWNIPHTRFF